MNKLVKSISISLITLLALGSCLGEEKVYDIKFSDLNVFVDTVFVEIDYEIWPVPEQSHRLTIPFGKDSVVLTVDSLGTLDKNKFMVFTSERLNWLNSNRKRLYKTWEDVDPEGKNAKIAYINFHKDKSCVISFKEDDSWFINSLTLTADRRLIKSPD